MPPTVEAVVRYRERRGAEGEAGRDRRSIRMDVDREIDTAGSAVPQKDPSLVDSEQRGGACVEVDRLEALVVEVGAGAEAAVGPGEGAVAVTSAAEDEVEAVAATNRLKPKAKDKRLTGGDRPAADIALADCTGRSGHGLT